MAAILPIPGRPIDAINYSDWLTDDAHLEVFQRVLTRRALRFPVSTLALVCWRWKHITDGVDFGRRFLESIGFSLPQGTQNWKQHYQYLMGSSFIQCQHEVKKHPYSQGIDVRVGEIRWVDGQGFIQFVGSQFRVCLFNNLTEFWPVMTSGTITALNVIHQKIVCGLENGMVEVYSFETRDRDYSYKAHSTDEKNPEIADIKTAVMDIFPFQDTWISVSRESVVQWDRVQKVPQTLVKHSSILPVPDYTCFNNQLFFTRDTFKGSIYAPVITFGESSFAFLDLLDVEKGIQKLDIPVSVLPKTHLLGWGDQMGTFIMRRPQSVTSVSIGRFHVNQKRKEGKFFDLEAPRGSFQANYFFRGNVAFIITDFPAQGHIGDGDFINVLNVRNGIIYLQHYTQAGIARNENGYICTIMGNSFMYLEEDSHELVVWEFSQPRPAEPVRIERDEDGKALSKRRRKD